MTNSKFVGVATSDPAIVGGTVDNTPIGATTPSTGAFTTLSATTVSGAGSFTTLSNTGAFSAATTTSALVAFHGATGVAQASFVATQSINALSVSGVVGFTSSTSFSAALTLLNAIQQVLVNTGLMAAS